MADWYGHARSSYFKVKDREKFKEFIKDWYGEYIEKEHEVVTDRCRKCLYVENNKDCINYLKVVVGECKSITENQMFVGFLGDNSNGGLPHYREDDDGTEYEWNDFKKELASHLEEGWVAQMVEVGAEKLRYVTGAGFVVNWKGEEDDVSLSYAMNKMAEKLGPCFTECEY